MAGILLDIGISMTIPGLIWISDQGRSRMRAGIFCYGHRGMGILWGEYHSGTYEFTGRGRLDLATVEVVFGSL